MSKEENLQGITQPSGIRWVAAYTVLIITGYGQYGLAFLLKGSELFLGIALTLLAISFTAATYSLLKHKRWAYKLTIVLYTTLICFEILRLYASGIRLDSSSADILFQFQAIVFASWILAYLKKEKIKVWFNKDELEIEKGPSAKEQMEEEVKLVRERTRNGLLIFAFPFLIVVSMWLSGKIAPIPEFSDLKLTTALLTKVTHTNGGRRGETPYLILKEDNGLVSSVHVGGDGKRFKPFVGHRVMVWSADSCSFFGYRCVNSALQVKYTNKYAQYRNKMILDYKIVRGHMEKVRYGVGIFDYLFGGIALFFLLLGVFVFYDAKRKVKVIQDRFNSERLTTPS